MRKHKYKDVLFYIALLLIWQIVYYILVNLLGVFKEYLFPNPIAVVKCLITLFLDGSLYHAILASVIRVLIGEIFAILMGSMIGMLMTANTYLRRNLKPILMGAQSLPSASWIPFAIFWFGISESSFVFIVFMGTVFSVSLVLEEAICGIPKQYIQIAMTMGASNKDIITRVILPAALPSYVLGLRQSWSFAWRALMSGEIISACNGLGYLLMMGRNMADMNQVAAIMLMIILIGALVDKILFSNLEKHIFRRYGMVQRDSGMTQE